ncbi:MAG: hypothetical protein QOG57_143 [Pseudonocardiales bacterium]|nr:hypothetical protein [Pseudonocardiales bacterium]
MNRLAALGRERLAAGVLIIGAVAFAGTGMVRLFREGGIEVLTLPLALLAADLLIAGALVTRWYAIRPVAQGLAIFGAVVHLLVLLRSGAWWIRGWSALLAAAHIYALVLFFALSAQEQYDDEDEDADEFEDEFNGDGPGGAGRGGEFAALPAQRRGPVDADWPRPDPGAAATAAGVEPPAPVDDPGTQSADVAEPADTAERAADGDTAGPAPGGEQTADGDAAAEPAPDGDTSGPAADGEQEAHGTAATGGDTAEPATPNPAGADREADADPTNAADLTADTGTARADTDSADTDSADTDTADTDTADTESAETDTTSERVESGVGRRGAADSKE